MDRAKAVPGKKGPKPKGHPPTGDFIALGKQSKGADSDIKRSVSPQPIGRKIPPAGERKRDAASTPAAVPGLAPKKPKLSSQTFTPLGRQLAEPERKGSPATVVTLQFEESAVDVEPADILDEIRATEEAGDDERIEGIMCGAVKSLRANRAKPDQVTFLTLMYLSKTQSSLFCCELVIEAFCSLLKRDMSLNFKAKGNPLVSVFACNTLMAAFSEEENWPDNFVKVYVDDSLGERVWVDRDDCKGFVDNILTAFNTKVPPKSMLMAPTETSKGDQSGPASPVLNLFDDDDVTKSSDGGDSEKSSISGDNETGVVFPRYPYQQDSIETFILDVIKEQLNRRQPMDASARNLIRLMSATCGYGEVRSLAAQRLEMWLQNPKLARTAQDLLMSVCMNCNQNDHSDLDVIAQLIKIRMKTKPLINHYLKCMRELLLQHPDNLRMILAHTIYNELSTARNPNNMALLGVAFQASPEPAAKLLAEIFQDLLANKDDYLRALRALLREVVRSLRHDMNFSSFCLGLMQERTEAKFSDMDSAFKERFVMAVADLITLSVLLGITPAVRETVASVSRGENKDIEVLQQFKQQVAVIQRDAIWWLHTVVPKMMELKPAEYVHCLHKVLFMEEAQHYYSKDNWPPESDRTMMLRLSAEVPVMEDTLMRILLIGLSRELPLNPADALELGDQLIRRAAGLYYSVGMQVLQVERLELIDALLKLCAYRHPENIALPKGYQPPTLAISALYWKSWIMLLIISAFNPTTFGLAAWENYPTLKCMMEMIMTNNFKFPPPTTATDDKMIEEIKNRERQIAQQEVQQILEFESHLAAATSKVTITEANSLLLDQLTTMDPTGIARSPPAKVLDQLQGLSISVKIGQMLCRSRSPDFLLDIIQRQGTSQSMPWLAELVESSEGSLDVLPVQCLCEFLLHEPPDLSMEAGDSEAVKVEKYKKRQKLKKQGQLLSRLQTLVQGTSSDSRTMFEVLDYFLKRLSSTQAANRSQAIRGLSMVVSKSQASQEDSESGFGSDNKMDVDADSGDTTHSWLLNHLPALPLFQEVKGQTSLALRQACQIETDPSLVSAYIIFLSQHALDQNLHDLDNLALDIAQLIGERTSVINHILPADGTTRTAAENNTLSAFICLYVNYLRKAKEPNREDYTWSNTQDQIILQWESGESATMRILVVNAMIILLTYGPPDGESQYQELLNTWFPENSRLPSAFLLDTSEEALLLPDWLKLRMIRSSVDQLVNAALQELEPSQLLLFVQSFGIPVSSMNKLLHCLDNAVELDGSMVEQAVVDKAYMAQLIEIQHKRGAKGGENFNRILTQRSLQAKQERTEPEPMTVEPSINPYWQIRKPQPEQLPANQNELITCLLQTFDTTISTAEQSNKMHHTIIKMLSAGEAKCREVIGALLTILDSSKGPEFVGKMFQLSHRSCPLVKLLLSKQRTLHKLIKTVVDKLAVFSKGQQSPLSAIIHQFLTSHGGKPSLTSKRQSSMNIQKYQSHGVLNSDKIIEDMKCLGEENGPYLELLVRQCMEETVKKHSSADGARIACSLLLDCDKGSAMTESAASLFIDWLELLDPEILQSNPEIQQQLLFAKKVHKKSGMEISKGRRNQPYLLALLTHQSNWATLHRCIERLLRRDHGIYDPTTVLDFLWACLHIPKIWQGRERKPAQAHSQEDVLGLKTGHILAIIDFIVEEAELLKKESTSYDQKSANQSSVYIGRIDLLLSCLCDDDTRLKAAVEYLQKMIAKKSSRESIYIDVLLELYLQHPYLISWLPESSPFLAELHSSQRCQSQLDNISHRMISALGHAVHGKTAENRMYDASMACRKLAAEHPVLVLRQLPMIAALLRGKTQFTFGEMRHRNFISLFNLALGLLELLQPHIFRKEHTSLPDVIEAYFSLMKAHGRDQKQLSFVIVKFVTFLHNFVSYDPQRAITILQKYTELLGDISSLYPDLSELKSLLAGLTLPRQNQTELAVNQGELTPVGSPIRSSNYWSAGQLAPFHKKLKKNNNTTDLLEVLQDLDEMSKRKVEILQHFENELKRLMTDENDRCRNTTFSLVMRHLRQNPKRSSSFVPVFLQCLGNSSPDIINTALRNLAEFTVLCQDYAQVILQKVFSVGITSSVETSSYISETLQLLNLETA